MTIPLSIVILTKNEEQDLPGCLASISWSDDIHLVDSGSNDQTVSIAQKQV
jgi:glycosyltransferase involved in cell wall biosynthesis